MHFYLESPFWGEVTERHRGQAPSYAQTKLVSPSGRDVAQRQRGQAPSYAQTKLVSPFGRDVAQRQRGLIPADIAFQIRPDTEPVSVSPSQSFASQMPALPRGEPRRRCERHALTNQANSCADLSACCPLSHLLRKCQLSQRESREAGANGTPDKPS